MFDKLISLKQVRTEIESQTGTLEHSMEKLKRNYVTTKEEKGSSNHVL